MDPLSPEPARPDAPPSTAALSPPGEDLTLFDAAVRMVHDAVIGVALDGTITHWNAAAEDLFGYHPAAAAGSSFSMLDCPEDGQDSLELLARLRRDVMSHAARVFRRRRNGSRVRVVLRITPLTSADGAILCFCATARAEGLIADDAERKRTEDVLAAAYLRERLLNTIGQATRAAINRDQVQQVAVNELGAALDVDRCYLLKFDLPGDVIAVQAEYRRASLAALPSPIAISSLDIDVERQFQDGVTLTMADTQIPEPQTAWSPRMAEIFARAGVRAVIAVPLYLSPAVMTLLCVAMAARPRSWSHDDIAIVEAVATQTRATSEAAVALERERTVAVQLQRALLPEIPDSVPGLKLGSYIRVAEQEMGVGGDFFDVFRILGKGTLLVVGDLTGKGLPAAAQVSTVRNMLRYAVVRGRTLSGAVANLNDVLYDQGLLSGFATLFVGAYYHGTRTLNYVNCGQEPALVCRARDGALTQLPPTGNVLGAFREAAYAEASIVLEAGDVLSIFTDGMTEVGTSRAAMLGMQGVSDLVTQKTTATRDDDPAVRAASLPLEIAAGLLEYGGGHLSDDICLLVAVVE